MVKAQNLYHLILVDHRDNTLSKLRRQYVIAEVKGLQLAQASDGIDDGAGAILSHLQLFHL